MIMRKGTAKPAPMGNIHPVSDTVLQSSKKKCAGKKGGGCYDTDAASGS